MALITPPTHGLEPYSIYGIKDQGFTFRKVHKTLFYHFTYLVTDFEKGTLIYTVYIFIRIENNYYTPCKLCLWEGILFSRPSERPFVRNVLFP